MTAENRQDSDRYVSDCSAGRCGWQTGVTSIYSRLLALQLSSGHPLIRTHQSPLTNDHNPFLLSLPVKPRATEKTWYERHSVD